MKTVPAASQCWQSTRYNEGLNMYLLYSNPIFYPDLVVCEYNWILHYTFDTKEAIGNPFVMNHISCTGWLKELLLCFSCFCFCSFLSNSYCWYIIFQFKFHAVIECWRFCLLGCYAVMADKYFTTVLQEKSVSETSETINLLTQKNTPEDLNLHQNHCENLKPHTNKCSFLTFWVNYIYTSSARKFWV
jgi:hypothetical protein